MLKPDELIDDENLYLDNGLDSTVAMQKKPPLFPNIEGIIESLRKDFNIRFFVFNEIPQAVAWAGRGNIAIHENYHSHRRRSYHVICSEKEDLLRFCKKIGVPSNYVTASDLYKFWHMTWFPEKEHNHVSGRRTDFQEQFNLNP